MRTIELGAGAFCPLALPLGRRAESGAAQIVFDFSSWREEFGGGVLTLWVKRPGDAEAYEAPLAIDGVRAVWTVSAADTAIVGAGSCEFWYAVDGATVKSRVYATSVLADIGSTTEELPDPYETWLDRMAALTARTETAASEAAQSTSEAARIAESIREAMRFADNGEGDISITWKEAT